MILLFSHNIDFSLELKNKIQKVFAVEEVETIYSLDLYEDVIKQKDPVLVFLHSAHEQLITEFTTNIASLKCKCVLISAGTKYAVRSFRCGFFDYLRSPVSIAELEQLKKRIAFEIQNKNTLDKITSKALNIKEYKKIVLSTDGSVYVVDIADIMYCESMGGYTHFYLIDDTKILVTKTLKEYDTALSSFDFIRVHKSFLINFKYVTRYFHTDGGYVLLANKHKIPVAFRKKELLINTINQLSIRNS